MVTFDEVTKMLKGVVKNGAGYKALCPGHDDHDPSLSVSRRDDGGVLLHCFAGCATEHVVKQLGLTMADLSPKSNGQHSKPKGLFDSFLAASEWMAQKLSATIADSWEYNREFHVVRFNKPDGSKEFKPFRREPGGWRIKDPTGKLPLYHLPELAAADVVWVLEGEKCADLARGLGLVATTSAHGSGAADKSDWSALAGKAVHIIPDNDLAGEKYANRVGSLLAKLDPKPVVKIVRLPLTNEGDDLDEWLTDVVPDTWTDVECREELLRLASAAEEWTAPPAPVEFLLTDTGNGERFAAKYSGDVHQVNAWSTWLIWHRGRWTIDETGASMRCAKRIARSIWKEVE
jgi:putative DNA primase/helicase